MSREPTLAFFVLMSLVVVVQTLVLFVLALFGI